MRKWNVGIIGCTGMVGQRFASLLENHPWFNVTVLAASPRSAGKTYEEATGKRWVIETPMPESMKKMIVKDASNIEEVASQADFVFCAVDMPKADIMALEEAYARAECPVISNNSAHRFTPVVPMIIPELNSDHANVILSCRLGTKRALSRKINCRFKACPASPVKYKDQQALCTYQAISGAGKPLNRGPKWSIM